MTKRVRSFLRKAAKGLAVGGAVVGWLITSLNFFNDVERYPHLREQSHAEAVVTSVFAPILIPTAILVQPKGFPGEVKQGLCRLKKSWKKYGQKKQESVAKSS
jgi:hypothetical protein